MNWNNALLYVACLNTNSYLGYSDWHLPNRIELTSLLNYESSDGFGWMIFQGFRNIKNMYWSSTSESENPFFKNRWFVWSSLTNVANIQSEMFVWPVRGVASMLPRTGQIYSYAAGDDGDTKNGVAWPDPRFINSSESTPLMDGVILDKLTGLMWTQDANSPGPNECSPAVPRPWQAALNYIDCLNASRYLGYSDWMLPNINEIESLVNSDMKMTQSTWLQRQGFSHVQDYAYWSSTTDAAAVLPFALVIKMVDGSRGPSDKPSNVYVWPVRRPQ